MIWRSNLKNFTTIQDENKLYIKFPFDKTLTIVKVGFIVLFFISILFFVKWNSIDFLEFFISYFICLSIFIYISLNSYLEWRKYGRKLYEKKDTKLYIDTKLITDLHQIKNIIINYESSNLSMGWFVQFDFYLFNKDIYIKRQLSEKIAQELAEKVADFFDVEIKKLG